MQNYYMNYKAKFFPWMWRQGTYKKPSSIIYMADGRRIPPSTWPGGCSLIQ
jgi:hypothetical protein